MTDPMTSGRLEELRAIADVWSGSKFGVETVDELVAEIDYQRAEVRRLQAAVAQRDDLRWLVGHLAGNCPDVGALPLPPRLASVVRECIESYEPGRFTLGVTLETTDD